MTISRSSLCNDVFNYITLRQEIGSARLTETARDNCIARHLPNAISQTELSLGQVDKIFAADWLDESHIICGTKCNKLLVQNIQTEKSWEIPLLKGDHTTPLPERNCGIHCISINPSSSLLATGAENPNSVGFYQLPWLHPVCIGEYHKDWLFSSAWISDNVLATGSRDKCIAFWNIEDGGSASGCSADSAVVKKPVQVIEGNKTLDKVRAMVYNSHLEHLATVASNGFLHLWDVNKCTQVASTTLPFHKENVCIAHQKKNLLYAVGSQSHVSLLEPRCGRTVGSLCSSDDGAGVRSISFNDGILTIGTGYGSILFYDIRMNKMLENSDGIVCRQKTGKGWLRRDSVYQQFFWDNESYPNAVYAHSYHPVSMKLLTAGGPLALGLYGNYAAYWD